MPADGAIAVWATGRACVEISTLIPDSLSEFSPKVAVDTAAAELAVEEAIASSKGGTTAHKSVRLITYRVIGK